MKTDEAIKKLSGQKMTVRKLGMDDFPSFSKNYKHKEGVVTPRIVKQVHAKEVNSTINAKESNSEKEV